jgi:H+-translocating NAD(P) transhydrogenase subunit alpha
MQPAASLLRTWSSFEAVKVAVVKESRADERRVGIVPELVGKFVELGYDVSVQSGAGEQADFSDDGYRVSDAKVESNVLDAAQIVVSVQPLELAQLERLDAGAATISFLPWAQSREFIKLCRDRNITAFSMELVPRISRAQSMDALSSQALVAGYRAGVLAAEQLRRFFPLNMTAAGTVRPADVVVLGAGVAGLQAIATAKRLGAVVKAYDVRSAAGEEIRSLGAQSIDLDLETLEGAGGYAREMTEDRAARQLELLTPYIAAADALITTAAVPGRQAPVLVTRAMVEQMKPGSVVIDLAAESGGNVEGSVAGETVRIGNARVWGALNLPSDMPGPASRLYAQNILNLLTLMTRDGAFAPDFEDEVVAGCCVTNAGEIMHQSSRELVEGSPS